MKSSTDSGTPKTFLLRKEGNKFVVPPELKQLFQSRWILTGLEDSLIAYEPNHWEEVKQQIQNIEFGPQKQALMRLLLARSSEVDFRRDYFRVPALFQGRFNPTSDLIACFEESLLNLTPSH